MDGKTFTFDRSNLAGLLMQTIQMYIEYLDQHGKDSREALACAVVETMSGLEAELELYRAGELKREQLTQVIE